MPINFFFLNEVELFLLLPKSATEIHQLVVDRKPNLAVERQTIRHILIETFLNVF